MKDDIKKGAVPEIPVQEQSEIININKLRIKNGLGPIPNVDKDLISISEIVEKYLINDNLTFSLNQTNDEDIVQINIAGKTLSLSGRAYKIPTKDNHNLILSIMHLTVNKN